MQETVDWKLEIIIILNTKSLKYFLYTVATHWISMYENVLARRGIKVNLLFKRSDFW